MPVNRKKIIEDLTKQLSGLHEQLSAEQNEFKVRQKQFVLLESVAQAMQSMLIKRVAIDVEDAPVHGEGAVPSEEPACNSSGEETVGNSTGYQCLFNAAVISSQPHQERLGAAEAPLSYLSAFCQAGPLARAETITLAELRSAYANMTRNALVQLQLLAKPFRQNLGQHDPGQQLVICVRKHLHLWTSLLVYGRGSLMYELALSDCLTGEKVEQHDLQPYQFAVGNLGLSQDQKQQIIEAIPTFKRLQQAVLDELQQVQQQQLQHAIDTIPTDDRVHLPRGMLAQPSPCCLQRAEHEERAEKLNMLLRKQHLLGACYNAYIFGCLTYEQVARFGVLLYPFPPFAYLLADALVAEQQQQQQ